MSKVTVLVLLVMTIALLSYLVFISFKLLRKAENERKAELNQKKSQTDQPAQLKDQDSDTFEN